MKASEIKGKTVITPEGDNIGTVEDVFLRPEEQRLGALVVKSTRFAAPQILLAEDISSLGGDAVPTQSAEKLQDQARFGVSAQMVSVGGTQSGHGIGQLCGRALRCPH